LVQLGDTASFFTVERFYIDKKKNSVIICNMQCIKMEYCKKSMLLTVLLLLTNKF